MLETYPDCSAQTLGVFFEGSWHRARHDDKARVTLNRDGSALVEAAAHDIGTGTYTIMAQVAADALGLKPDRVTVRLGDTRLPESHPAIGSATAANATTAVMLAAQAARAKAVQLALTGREAPFADSTAGDVIAAEGGLTLARKNLNITLSCSRGTGSPRSVPTRTTIRSKRQTAPRQSSASPPCLLRCASTRTSGSCA
jgi:CO/xanthine dehydrogenase Mo-binding subunit